MFSGFFLKYFIKNPQTRNADTFLPLNISAIGRVITNFPTSYTLWTENKEFGFESDFNEEGGSGQPRYYR